MRLEIPCKGRYGGHDDPDLERLAFSVGADDAFDNDSSEFVGYGMLLVTGGSDEELDTFSEKPLTWGRGRGRHLVLNVDAVLCVGDGISIGVCDGMLGVMAG